MALNSLPSALPYLIIKSEEDPSAPLNSCWRNCAPPRPDNDIDELHRIISVNGFIPPYA